MTPSVRITTSQSSSSTTIGKATPERKRTREENGSKAEKDRPSISSGDKTKPVEEINGNVEKISLNAYKKEKIGSQRNSPQKKVKTADSSATGAMAELTPPTGYSKQYVQTSQKALANL